MHTYGTSKNYSYFLIYYKHISTCWLGSCFTTNLGWGQAYFEVVLLLTAIGMVDGSSASAGAAYCGRSWSFGSGPPCSSLLVHSELVMLGSPDLWNLSTFHGLVMIKWESQNLFLRVLACVLGAQKTLTPFPSFSHVRSKTTHCIQLKSGVEPRARRMEEWCHRVGTMGSLRVFEITLTGFCVSWLLVCSQLEWGGHSVPWTNCIVVLNESFHCHAWDSVSVCCSGLRRRLRHLVYV